MKNKILSIVALIALSTGQAACATEPLRKEFPKIATMGLLTYVMINGLFGYFSNGITMAIDNALRNATERADAASILRLEELRRQAAEYEEMLETHVLISEEDWMSFVTRVNSECPGVLANTTVTTNHQLEQAKAERRGLRDKRKADNKKAKIKRGKA